MFVFKAAVVGAGDAAREIAEAIEAAGVESCARTASAFDGFGDVDFVDRGDAASDMEIKHRVFAELDASTPGHAVLATTTAELSITEIGEITLRPDKVVGLHFAGPRVVEVVEGDDTSAETAQVAANFVQALRRTAVRCVECPGFVVNRVLPRSRPSAARRPSSRARCATPTATASSSRATSAMTPSTSAPS